MKPRDDGTRVVISRILSVVLTYRHCAEQLFLYCRSKWEKSTYLLEMIESQLREKITNWANNHNHPSCLGKASQLCPYPQMQVRLLLTHRFPPLCIQLHCGHSPCSASTNIPSSFRVPWQAH